MLIGSYFPQGLPRHSSGGASFGITEAAQLGRVIRIGLRLIELLLGEAVHPSKDCTGQARFGQVCS